MFDTKEMQTKSISNMAERLNALNFRARFREDGDLTVSSSINFLGVVGKTGELYCNSKDLCNPYRRFQLERILQTMDAVRTEMVQANTSTPEEALELETLLGAYPSRQQAQEEKPKPKQNEDATLKMVYEQSSEKNPSQSNLAEGLPELCFSTLPGTGERGEAHLRQVIRQLGGEQFLLRLDAPLVRVPKVDIQFTAVIHGNFPLLKALAPAVRRLPGEVFL